MSGMQSALIQTCADRRRAPSSRIRSCEAGLVDWTGRYRGKASAVIRPGSVEVAEIVRACRAAHVPLVPQGGNTGLVGGGIPRDGAVLLSLRRLTTIEDVDPDSGTVVAGAGATVAAVHLAAAEAGWAYGVDLAARDSATVGGDRDRAGGTCSATADRTRCRVSRPCSATRTSSARPASGRARTPWPAAGRVEARSASSRPQAAHCRASIAWRWPSSGSRASIAVRLAGSLRRTLPSLNAVELIAATRSPRRRRRGPSVGARHRSTSWSRWPTSSNPSPPGRGPPSSPRRRHAVVATQPGAGCGAVGRACPRPCSAGVLDRRRLRWGGWPRSRAWYSDDRAGVARGAPDPVWPPARRQPPRQRDRPGGR